MSDPLFWSVNEDYYKEYYKPPEVNENLIIAGDDEVIRLLSPIKEQVDQFVSTRPNLFCYWDTGKTSVFLHVKKPPQNLFLIEVERIKVNKFAVPNFIGYKERIVIHNLLGYTTLENKYKKPKKRTFSYKRMYEIIKDHEKYWNPNSHKFLT